jgi:hypothetical protein
MMQGWISLHRKILDNPIVCKNSDYFSVWCYLLLKATHKEREVLFKNEVITLKKGQLITGRKSIASKFNITESKVQRILKRLEIEQQIEQQTSTKNRLITVLNWEDYQESEQQIEQQVNNKRTTSEQQVNTNNSDNNNNNDNKDIKDNCHNKVGDAAVKFDINSFEIQLTDYLISKIKEELPNARTPNNLAAKQKWAVHVDRMRRIDKRTDENIRKVLKYATTDSFWKTNILSTKKLRDKFDTLYAQCSRNKQQQDNMNMMKEWVNNETDRIC